MATDRYYVLRSDSWPATGAMGTGVYWRGALSPTWGSPFRKHAKRFPTREAAEIEIRDVLNLKGVRGFRIVPVRRKVRELGVVPGGGPPGPPGPMGPIAPHPLTLNAFYGKLAQAPQAPDADGVVEGFPSVRVPALGSTKLVLITQVPMRVVGIEFGSAVFDLLDVANVATGPVLQVQNVSARLLSQKRLSFAARAGTRIAVEVRNRVDRELEVEALLRYVPVRPDVIVWDAWRNP